MVCLFLPHTEEGLEWQKEPHPEDCQQDGGNEPQPQKQPLTCAVAHQENCMVNHPGIAEQYEGVGNALPVELKAGKKQEEDSSAPTGCS